MPEFEDTRPDAAADPRPDSALRIERDDKKIAAYLVSMLREWGAADTMETKDWEWFASGVVAGVCMVLAQNGFGKNFREQYRKILKKAFESVEDRGA